MSTREHLSPEKLPRLGNAEWTNVELAVRRLSSEFPTAPRELELPSTPSGTEDLETDPSFDVVLQTASTDSSVSLSASLSAAIPELIEYRVHIIGTWPHTLGRELSPEEQQSVSTGYRLDELAAVMNYELQSLSSRFNESFPAISQELLEQVRNRKND